MRCTIKGIQELQRKNEQMIRALQPGSAFGEAIRQVLIFAHRYAVTITPVDTGALRASHRMKMKAGRLRGEVHIDESTRNPKSNTPPYQYGVYVHRRGGRYAFYSRVLDEKAGHMGQVAGRTVIGAL